MKPSGSRPAFDGVPLIGILRGIDEAYLPQILECLRNGGMTHLEITMNSPGALEQIQTAARLAGSGLKIGAGTVTNLELLERATAAGATFIVTPAFLPDIITRCVSSGVPVFPGAFSPTEIYEAWELGSSMVKVFPADAGGAAFIRALRGPFPEIQLLPTGGVGSNTLPELLKAGAAGAGIGSPLFQPDRLKANDWAWLEDQVRNLVKIYGELSRRPQD